MMIGFNCDVVVGAAVEVVGAVVVGVEVVGAAVEVVGAVVVGVEVVGVEVVVVGAAVVVVGGAVVAWSACGLGSATSLELLPHDAVSRLIARTHDPQSLRPAHLMPDSSPRPTKRRPKTTERPEISGLSSIIRLVELGGIEPPSVDR